ncbi:MAG: flavin reductase [Acidaminococcaceae bacterium]
MQNIELDELAHSLTKGINNYGGALLTTANDDKVNSMTIGWAMSGMIFGKNVLMLMVRHSRYTYELLAKNTEVTLTIPLDDALKPALGLCGSKSGRCFDKLEAAGLKTQSGQVVSTPIIKANAVYVEGKVILQQDVELETLAPDLKAKWYANGDCHRLYFLEILTCYK